MWSPMYFGHRNCVVLQEMFFHSPSSSLTVSSIIFCMEINRRRFDRGVSQILLYETNVVTGIRLVRRSGIERKFHS